MHGIKHVTWKDEILIIYSWNAENVRSNLMSGSQTSRLSMLSKDKVASHKTMILLIAEAAFNWITGFFYIHNTHHNID